MAAVPVTYQELDAALAQMQLGTTASDLHGALTGWLCGGSAAGAAGLLEALALESDDAHTGDAAHRLLDRLCAQCREQLRASDASFAPLLPAAPLAARADAMVDWCRGFLGGLGLTGAIGRHALPEDAREILADLGHIAAMPVVCENEDDEQSLSEVLDFIRNGVLRLHAELASDPRGGRT